MTQHSQYSRVMYESRPPVDQVIRGMYEYQAIDGFASHDAALGELNEWAQHGYRVVHVHVNERGNHEYLLEKNTNDRSSRRQPANSL